MNKLDQSTSLPHLRAIRLRGGRMTKYKGQVASYAPALGRVLTGVSAAALGATTLLTADSALAGSCVPQVPGIFLCSGPADPVNDISVTIINGAPISVETTPGFGIDPFNSANAMDLFSNSGLTFTDNNASTIISRSNDALRAVVYGGGDLTVTTTGTLSGARHGIYARNYGVLSAGNLSITAANVSGATVDGIYARNDRGTGLSVTTSGIVSGGRSGIHARNTGSGALTITTAAVSGSSADGIFAYNGATGTDLSVTAGQSVSGGNNGIMASNHGTGTLTVSTAGVTGTNGFGIRAANYGSGTDLSVTASGAVTGSRSAISASNRGSGGLTIDVGDAISTNDGYGINARNYGAGALVISAANATGSANNSGIFAGNSGTDLSITTSGLVTSNWRGISARNTGTGDMTLSVADVTSTRLNGLNLTNYGANLSITSTGTISAVTKGIEARNQGSGALTVSVNNVTGTTEEGIYLLNAASGTDLSITAAGTVTGTTGIAATNQGRGSLTISTSDVAGTAGNGLIARNEGGTDLSINTQRGTVTSSGDGIVALNDGSGALTISSAVVTATGPNGIFALNRAPATDLSITTSGPVTGSVNGLYAVNLGSGALTISTAGAIGSSGAGIYARNEGNADLTISTSGTVSGGFRGIYVRNYGNGALRVNVAGIVMGGTGAAIDARTNSGGMSVITLGNGASVSSTSGEAITNNEGNSQVILKAGSTVAGAVLLSDGIDELTIEGGADISAATLFDGGGGTQDALTFSSFSGDFDGTLFSNWESLTADNGSTLSLDSSASGIGFITANNGSTIKAGDANLSLNSSLQIDATSSFRAGFAGSGAVSVNGDVSNDGLVSLVDGHGGDRLTIGGDLSGSGTVALDVDFDAGTNDRLIVTGNSTGAQQGLQVRKSGDQTNLQTYALASVTGASSANDFHLANGDFVTKGGEAAIVGGAYTFLLDYDPATGEFVLTPFTANGGVNMNPNRAFLAAGIQQFSDQIALDGALRRLTGRTGSEDANTVSRSLIELSSTDQPLVWLNAEGGRDRYTSGDRTNETTSGGLRVGASLPFAEIGSGSLIGGFEFGTTTLSTNSETSLADGKIDTDAYDVTLSALWLADSQLYLDGQVRYAFFDSTTRLAGGQEVDTDGDGYAASIEIGKFFRMNNGLNIIPQAQLLYSSVDADDLNDVSSGVAGTVSDGDTLSARIGLRAEREFGTGVFFGQFDYYHAFDDETGVSFGNNTILTERGRNNLALTLGGHMDIAANTILFGEVSAQSGFGSSSDDYGVAGQLGFEFRF